MDEPLIPTAKGSRGSINRTDSKEMTEMASDTQSEETGKLMVKMDQYEVITDPVPGKWSKLKLKKQKDKEKNEARGRAETWNGRHRTPKDSPISPVDRIKDSIDLLLDNRNPTGYIQGIYAEEGFGPRHHRFSNSDERFSIDGRLSSVNENDEGFISVESVGVRDMSTTQALELCNKYVLKPFHAFLKVIGWRPFFSARLERVPWYKRVVNVLYPGFVFLMLLFTSATQVVTCFSRSQATRPPLLNGTFQINCENNVVSSMIVGDVLILVAFLWSLHTFRFSEREHLSALIETVFLSCNSRLVRRSQRTLVFVLLSFLLMGCLWLCFSLGLSIGRLFVLELTSENSCISWFDCLDNDDKSTDDRIAWAFIAFGILGFIFFDLLYIAVVINYCSQCQLLHFYAVNITEKIRHKAYTLADAIKFCCFPLSVEAFNQFIPKEMYRLHEFLQVLNDKLALITSLVFFIFVQGVVLSYINYMKVEPKDYLAICVGLGNLIQWTTATIFPLIMAARLTATCKGLKKIGLELGSRPFVYSDTPQLVLDSFLLYTHATNYRAKLGCFSIHPEYIFIVLVVLGLLLTLDSDLVMFRFAPWI